jgi:hypothetical protein
MKYIVMLILATASCAFAQDGTRTNVMYQSAGPNVATAVAIGRATNVPVQGAPYSASITNESIQTLADGTHITQNSMGSTARDSQGRTRQDAMYLSAADAPHLVFIMDPVAQASYTLNLTDKTAQKMSTPSLGAAGMVASGASGPAATKFFVARTVGASTMSGPPPQSLQPGIVIQKDLVGEEEAQISSEDLGSQTMEGLLVNGVRTTRTIPEGQIGNDKPIRIVTEVWTSPDLKTVVYSKRSDPRMGEQTFKLTNIVRTEPDPSLFAVPADFKIVDGPQNVIYRSNQ